MKREYITALNEAIEAAKKELGFLYTNTETQGTAKTVFLRFFKISEAALVLTITFFDDKSIPYPIRVSFLGPSDNPGSLEIEINKQKTNIQLKNNKSLESQIKDQIVRSLKQK